MFYGVVKFKFNTTSFWSQTFIYKLVIVDKIIIKCVETSSQSTDYIYTNKVDFDINTKNGKLKWRLKCPLDLGDSRSNTKNIVK